MKVGEHYIYWSDYNHKKLWSLRKDGSSKRPIVLRTFRNPAMGVVVFRHQPLNCSAITSNANHQAKKHVMENTETIIVTLMILTSLTVVAAVAILIFRFGRVMVCVRPFLTTQTEGSFAFQNFENPIPGNAYKMCERVI